MGVTNLKQWASTLELAERKIGDPGRIIRLQRTLTFLTLGAAVELSPGRFHRVSGVVLLTPVDTGRARSSWNVAVGTPDTTVPAEGSYPGEPRIDTSSLSSLGAYQTVWITSSLPYIEVLEFGGYPDPVQLGTWDRKLKRFVIRSSGGYSKQAPLGMVRITFDQVRQALRAAA